MNTRQVTSTSNGGKTTKVENDRLPADVTVCRVCLAQDRVMESMFEVPTSQAESISDRILYCTGVKFTQQDGLSEKICKLCVKHLNIAHKFKISCLSSDELYYKLMKEQMVYLDCIDDNGYSPTRVDDEKVKAEVLTDLDDDFRDDENEQDSKSDTKVKPAVKRKYRKSAVPRKNKKFIFKKLYCESCDIKFKTKEEQSSHNSKIHKDSTGFMCEICGKVFAHRSSHFSHMKSHTAPLLRCAHCDYSTAYKADLGKHLRIHTGEKRFQCEYCSAAYYTSSNLMEHRRINHNPVKAYRFACPQCGNQYYDRSKFQRHMDTHDGIRRHECDICNSRFTRRCYLKRHLLSRHGVVIPRLRPGRQKTNPLIVNPVLEKEHPVLHEGLSVLQEGQSVLQEGQTKTSSD